MVDIASHAQVRGSKTSKIGGEHFTNQHICRACDAAPDSPEKICKTVNGVVKTAFRNLRATGRGPDESARSALVVLRIHEPTLCACNMNFVRDWLIGLKK